MATYTRNSRAQCPHCLTTVRFEHAAWDSGQMPNMITLQSPGNKDRIHFFCASCPECGRLILTLGPQSVDTEGVEPSGEPQEVVVWPLQSARPPVPKEVPKHIASDYQEAALVMNFSPKASAALSRRCLQAVLREAGRATQHNLSQQIDAVMADLPSYIAESVDHIRNVGNFAAHPVKDQASGQIVDVQPGEAEWNLDVLDMLFDHYYVKPALAVQKREELNAKLEAAGERPMK
jgi:hypothetical protein